jgi:hypothetical protein
MKRLILMIAVGAIAACGGAQQRADDLMDSVRGYNEGVRWNRYETAAAAVPPKERDQFIEDREDLEKELHISDYEVIRVGATKDRSAHIEVKYTWFKDSEGIVRETRAIQTWERHGKAWMIIDERRTHGPEMPGLREPDADDPPAPGESAKKPDPEPTAAPTPEAAVNP